MAGLGAYPVKSDPKPGQGPSKLEALEDVTDVDEMNFETVHNIDEFAAESVTTMREALKCWNMTVQWWLVANVYRRLPGMYCIIFKSEPHFSSPPGFLKFSPKRLENGE